MADFEWLQRIAPCVRAPEPGSKMRSYSYHHRHHANWIEPMRVIYDYELVLFSEGSFIVEIEGQAYPCKKGSFIIIPPGHQHITWENAGRFGRRHWSHFDWVYQGPHGETPIMTFAKEKPRTELYRWAPDFVPQQIFHGSIVRMQRVMELSERLSALQISTLPHARLISRALLLEILLELFHEPDALEKTPSRQSQLEDRARQILDANVERHASVRLEDLLEQTGYSYPHVCRVFKKRYGIPPLKYLHLLCISRAKLMLRDTQLPVSTIAERLAFSDPEYFAQVFRRTAGMSPTKYRAVIREEANAAQPV
jgi:AraC-like DNA-binding protein